MYPFGEINQDPVQAPVKIQENSEELYYAWPKATTKSVAEAKTSAIWAIMKYYKDNDGHWIALWAGGSIEKSHKLSDYKILNYALLK